MGQRRLWQTGQKWSPQDLTSASWVWKPHQFQSPSGLPLVHCLFSFSWVPMFVSKCLIISFNLSAFLIHKAKISGKHKHSRLFCFTVYTFMPVKTDCVSYWLRGLVEYIFGCVWVGHGAWALYLGPCPLLSGCSVSPHHELSSSGPAEYYWSPWTWEVSISSFKLLVSHIMSQNGKTD